MLFVSNKLKHYYSFYKLYVYSSRFGYNLVICYEYISKGETDKALKAIGDIEHDVLSSIGNNDPFLKSIQTALNHVTLSTKSHLLKLCAFGTEVCINPQFKYKLTPVMQLALHYRGHYLIHILPKLFLIPFFTFYLWHILIYYV